MNSTTTLAPIAPKLGKLIRLLGSPVDAECLGAARGIDRMLKGAGSDLHTLAEIIVEAPALALAPPPQQKSHLDIKRMAEWCLQRGAGRLSERERGFLANVSARWSQPTEKQTEWLRAIYARLWTESRR